MPAVPLPTEVQVKASEPLEAQKKIRMDHLVSSPPEPPRKTDDVLAPSSLSQLETDVRGAPTMADGSPSKNAATVADSKNGSRASPMAEGGVQQVNATNTKKKTGLANVGSKTVRTPTLVKRGECRECHEMGHHRNVCPQITCLSCKKKGHMARDCPCWECGAKGHRKPECPIVAMRWATTQCFNCLGFGHFAKRCTFEKTQRAKAGGKMPDIPETSGGFDLVREAMAKGTLPRQYNKEVVAEHITKDGAYSATKEQAQQRLQAIDVNLGQRAAAVKKRMAEFEEEIRKMQLDLSERTAEGEAMKKEIVEQVKKAHAEVVKGRVVLHEVVAAIKRELPKDAWLDKAKAKKVRKAAHNPQPEDSDEATPLVISTGGDLTPLPAAAPVKFVAEVAAPVVAAAPAAAPVKGVAEAAAPVVAAAPAAAPVKVVAEAAAPVVAAAPAMSSPERRKRERSASDAGAVEEAKEDDEGDNARSKLQDEEAATTEEEVRGSTKHSRPEAVTGGVGMRKWGKEKKGSQGNSAPPTTAP